MKGKKHSEETKKKMSDAMKGNSYGTKHYIRCIETGEVHFARDWSRLGYSNASKVASGRYKSCRGLHFEYVD